VFAEIALDSDHESWSEQRSERSRRIHQCIFGSGVVRGALVRQESLKFVLVKLALTAKGSRDIVRFGQTGGPINRQHIATPTGHQ